MPESPFDIAIAGGGPAGSIAAALCARAGRRVVLFEKDRLPREKLCGEFLSGEALGVLARAGVLEDLRAVGPAPVEGARFVPPSGRALDLRVPAGSIGISRRAFDHLLLRHAERSGAEVLEEASVIGVSGEPPVSMGGPERSRPCPYRVTVRRRRAGACAEPLVVESRLVLGAYGRRSSLDRSLGRTLAGEPRVGFKRHHRPASERARRLLARELGGVVEVYAFSGGYCGVGFVEGGEVTVCMLLEEDFVRRLPAPRWEEIRVALARAHPPLARRLDALEPSEAAVHAVAGVAFSRRERSARGVLLLGDAAGMIAPLCGGGQAMAVDAAAALADLVTAGRVDAAALGERWDRLWRRRYGRRMRLGNTLQRTFLRRLPAEVAVGLGTFLPAVAQRLVRATHG